MLKTLHSKLLVLIIIVTFLPISLVGVISYRSQKEALTNQLEDNLFLLANNLSNDIEVFIRERINDTNLLTKNPILRSPSASKEEKVKEFQNFLDIHEEYFGAIFVNKEGIVTVDMDDTVIGRNVGDREWFGEALKGKVYLSDIYRSNIVHNPILALSGSVRDDNDQIIGVLSPSLNLDYLYGILDRYSNEKKNLGLTGYAFLLNANGDIIAHIDRTKILEENYFEINHIDYDKLKEVTETRKLFHSDSLDTMNAFASIGKIEGFNNEWYVGVAIDRTEFYAPLNSLFKKYVLIFVLLLVIVSYVIIKFSNYIVNPVKKLVVATSDFAKGEKLPHLELNTYQEINKLSDTFNMMMDKLEIRERGHKKSTLVLEKINNGVLSVNKKNNKITTFNNKCEEIFNVKKEEVIGINVLDLCKVNEGFKSFYEHSSLNSILLGEQNNGHFEEFECTSENGRFIFFGGSSILSLEEQNQEQQEVIMVFSDITEKRLMEEKLIQSGKLEVAGQIAAGVAHEIRNPLTTIRAVFQLLFKQNECEKPKMKYERLLMQELTRINEILNGFLSLAKPDYSNEKVETDITKILDDILSLMEPQALLNNIKIVKEYTPNQNVPIDVNRIKQVCINLIKNSIEAMPEGGSLTVKSSYLESEQSVIITFTDTGKGMDQETLAKLGTPFFTTKDKGIGLGTMTSYRIIEEMNGKLYVETELGVGTTFIIKLPISD